MRSTKCKGEYLAVEAALNTAGEEAEEEAADQKDLWMLYQLLGICGRSILLFVHTLVFIEDGHWELDKNCKDKVKVVKPQVSSPIIRNPIAGRIWMPEQMMKGQARLGTLSEVRADPS